MSKLRLLSAFAGAALLAGCAGLTSESEVERLNQAQLEGSQFTQHLAEEYRDFANFEQYEMYDYRSAQYFARKGLRAAGGETVAPEQVSDWDVGNHAAELEDARSRLVAALDGNARQTFPQDAAVAQARFDCWVEQQEEGWQSEDIAACRNEFEAALARLAVEEEPMPDPDGEPAFFTFFDWDRTEITPTAAGVLDTVVADYQDVGATSIHVIGHADRSGPAAYNQGLSERRAASVRDALIDRGIPASAITTEGRGENEPLVPTEDGVREPSNRRAEISFN